MKPSPSFAEEIFGGHAAVAENHFGGVAGAHAQLIFFFAGTKPGRAFLDDERGNAVLLFRGIGDGHGDANVGVVAVGGECFRAVEHPSSITS